jgi:hypothetical protein
LVASKGLKLVKSQTAKLTVIINVIPTKSVVLSPFDIQGCRALSDSPITTHANPLFQYAWISRSGLFLALDM